jgi:hypothetical protein
MTVTIVETRAPARAITGGVDTHADVHVAAALDPVGGLLGVQEFPATPAGYAQLLGWLRGFGGYLAPPRQRHFHGFLWRNGTMTDLPPVGGAAWAFGDGVNDHGQVAGNETDAHGNELLAVLWSGGHGYDLNTLVAPNPLQMISADYINNQGDIVGHGVLPNGDQRMFLLTRNPGVPLPPASAPAGPLPAITGPPDRSISMVLALHAAHHGSTPTPSATH